MERIRIESGVKANYRRAARRARTLARSEGRAIKLLMKRIPHGARPEGYTRTQRIQYAKINGPTVWPSQLT
jgi:hypothetical protein